MAVLHHMTHGPFFDLGMIEMHEKGRGPFAGAPVGHFDLKDRLAVIGDLIPDPDTVQKPPRSQCHRIASSVKAYVLADFFVQCVNHGDPLTGAR